MISPEWHWLPLASVVGQSGGCITPGPSPGRLQAVAEHHDGDVPVIVPACITSSNSIDPKPLRYVVGTAAARMARFATEPGDVVIVRQGALGRAAVTEEAHRGWLISPACARITVGTNGPVRPDYLAGYLTQPKVMGWLLARASGQTVLTVTMERLADLPVLVPPLHVQHRIASASIAVDAQIARHERAIQLLGDLRKRQAEDLFEGRLSVLPTSDPSSSTAGRMETKMDHRSNFGSVSS